jgi:farnesyl-diphosphate farnesyltransferase
LSTYPASHELLHRILKQVSRSFYLTLNVLPDGVRDQMGLSYLFARAADTIADTDLIDRAQRLKYLNTFRSQFQTESVDWEAVREIQTALAPHQKDSGESILLQRLEDCFRLYEEFSSDDRKRIRWLMEVLPQGMEMDLTRFQGDSSKQLTALSTLDELDKYTYYVAGCVGEFWTQMVCAHRPGMTRWNIDEMAPLGVRFGKGLQLTNVVKDIARDLRNGRCYVPETLLAERGLKPQDLLVVANLRRFQPVLSKLIALAMEHLDEGWIYTMSIPVSEIRQRLACIWPILLAGETLKRVAVAEDLLDPSVNVKVPRAVVYRMMAITTLTCANAFVATSYWNHLRNQLARPQPDSVL